MNKTPIVAQTTESTWTLPRSIDSYKELFHQATMAGVKHGLGPMDAMVIAAETLCSIGIHVPSAMEKTPHNHEEPS